MEIKKSKSLKEKCLDLSTRMYAKIKCKKGEGYIDSGIKILMAVVIGALILGGIYLLWGDTIMPTLNKRIQEMFDYKG